MSNQQVTGNNPKYKVGDFVHRKAFTDCFGEYRAQAGPLVVVDVELVPCEPSFPDWWRVRARGAGLCEVYEGAERFFVVA